MTKAAASTQLCLLPFPALTDPVFISATSRVSSTSLHFSEPQVQQPWTKATSYHGGVLGASTVGIGTSVSQVAMLTLT